MTGLSTDASILIIYTGGTIGSAQDPETGGLVPIDFSEIHRHVPELDQPGRVIDAHSFDPPIDSSNMGPSHWRRLVAIIASRYDEFDGFVILHGTDTLAYTASALSFMMSGLHKPVILTGSQLPIGLPRTDGRENLLAAVEIAAASRFGEPLVQEVAVYFGSSLYRGNRTHKESAESLQAIVSPNFPALAEAGVDILYNTRSLWRDEVSEFSTWMDMEERLAWLPLFPGMSMEVLERVVAWDELRGLVLATYGSGNAPSDLRLKEVLTAASDRGVTVVNVSQCGHGAVHPERYATAHLLRDCGVIPGGDMTTEAALTKMMHVLAVHGNKRADIRSALAANLRGERSDFSSLI
jgi:L-asparaginase